MVRGSRKSEEPAVEANEVAITVTVVIKQPKVVVMPIETVWFRTWTYQYKMRGGNHCGGCNNTKWW